MLPLASVHDRYRLPALERTGDYTPCAGARAPDSVVHTARDSDLLPLDVAEIASARAVFDLRCELYSHMQRLSLAYTRDDGRPEISRSSTTLNTAQGVLERVSSA